MELPDWLFGEQDVEGGGVVMMDLEDMILPTLLAFGVILVIWIWTSKAHEEFAPICPCGEVPIIERIEE